MCKNGHLMWNSLFPETDWSKAAKEFNHAAPFKKKDAYKVAKGDEGLGGWPLVRLVSFH